MSSRRIAVSGCPGTSLSGSHHSGRGPTMGVSTRRADSRRLHPGRGPGQVDVLLGPNSQGALGYSGLYFPANQLVARLLAAGGVQPDVTERDGGLRAL